MSGCAASQQAEGLTVLDVYLFVRMFPHGLDAMSINAHFEAAGHDRYEVQNLMRRLLDGGNLCLGQGLRLVADHHCL